MFDSYFALWGMPISQLSLGDILWMLAGPFVALYALVLSVQFLFWVITKTWAIAAEEVQTFREARAMTRAFIIGVVVFIGIAALI